MPTFNVNVVVGVSTSGGRFSDLEGKSATRVLQTNLRCVQSDLRKYLMAILIDGIEYFYTSDDEMVWANGLDGKSSLVEAFRLFDSAEDAREFLLDRQPAKAASAMVYSMMRAGDTLTLIPHVRYGLLAAA